QNSFPDWAQITFAGTPTIHAVTVYSLQDNFSSGGEPTDALAFTQNGLTSFDVQVQSGSSWTTVASVVGNTLVKRTVAFAPTATTAVRIVCNAGMNGYSRIVEIEAWGADSIRNVALGTTGATATASDASVGYPATALNDGLSSGNNWDAGGMNG